MKKAEHKIRLIRFASSLNNKKWVNTQIYKHIYNSMYRPFELGLLCVLLQFMLCARGFLSFTIFAISSFISPVISCGSRHFAIFFCARMFTYTHINKLMYGNYRENDSLTLFLSNERQQTTMYEIKVHRTAVCLCACAEISRFCIKFHFNKLFFA